jgi:hypothetical protein
LHELLPQNAHKKQKPVFEKPEVFLEKAAG